MEPSDKTAQAIAALIVGMSYRVTKGLVIVMTDVTQDILTVSVIHVSMHIDMLIHHLKHLLFII